MRMTRSVPGSPTTAENAPTIEFGVATEERPRGSSAPAIEILVELAGLVLLAVLVLLGLLSPTRGVVPSQLLILGLLLTVPGAIVGRVLRQPGRLVAALMVPMSLVILLAVGLATSLAGPTFGIERPLRAVPQLLALELVCLLLLAISARRTVAAQGWSWPRPGVPWTPDPVTITPVLVAGLGFMGSRLLNSGQGSVVAIAAVILSVGLFAVAAARAPRLSDGALGITLYGVALAWLWSFSNRSEAVYGWDVTSEFRKMIQTLEVGQWSLLHVNDAYGAMLSVTVLPAQLVVVSGFPVLSLVSIVYPAIFAITPVLIFLGCRAFLDKRWSFFAAGIVVAQTNFGAQLPALTRQEIAFVLLAGLLLVLSVDIRPRWVRHALGTAFAGGVVVTHYSTTYLAIPFFGVAVLVLGVLVVLRRASRSSVVLVGGVLVVLVFGAALWNIVLTRSAANVTSTFASLNDRGFSLLGNTGSGNIVATYLQGTVTPQLTAADYEQLVERAYEEQRPYIEPLPQASLPQYALEALPEEPVSWLTFLNGAIAFVVRQGVLLAAGIGAVMLTLRRTTDDGLRIVAALGVGAVLTLVGIRLSGTIAASYNQDRALLQALVVLAPCIAWSGQALAGRRLATPRLVSIVAATVLAAQLLVSSSLLAVPNGLGGINVTNNSEDYRRFYSRWGEIAGATWLSQNTRREDILYADRYGSLRLLLASGRYEGVFPEMVPTVIDGSGWVFATTTNIEGTARSETFGRQGRYAFPEEFLNENFDVVYSNGLSRVYHRLGR